MKTFFINSFLLLIINIYAQAPSIEWQKSLGGGGQDYAKFIRQTSDGGYIVVGETVSSNGMITNNYGSYDCWVVKLNSTGALQWQKSLGGSDYDSAYSVSETSEGGFVIIGNTESNNFDVTGHYGNFDAWVVKLSSAGNIEWQKTYGGSSTDYGLSIQQTTDGGYILSGSTFSTNGVFSTGQGGWIIKINNLGVIQWQKKIGSFQSYIYSVLQTNDGGFIAAGTSNGPLGNTDYHIVKLNSNGVIQWEKYYGGTSSESAKQIQQTTDGGYIVIGSTNSSNTDVTQNNGSTDFWVIKLDSLGILQWQKTLGGSSHDYGDSIHQTTDGGFVVCGYTSSTNGMITGNHGYLDYWVVKLNNLGNVLWQKALGGSGDDQGISIRQTSDDGFIVAGSTGSSNGDVTNLYGDRDFWIVKLSPDNLSLNEFANSNDLKIYPNPVKNILQIQSELKIIKLEVFDITGRSLIENKLIENKIDLTNLLKGNYILKVYTQKGIINSTIVKE